MKVTPKAKKTGIEMMPDGSLKVKVSEPPEDGRANAAVIEALAKHYRVPKRAVVITQGSTGRHKIVEVGIY